MAAWMRLAGFIALSLWLGWPVRACAQILSQTGVRLRELPFAPDLVRGRSEHRGTAKRADAVHTSAQRFDTKPAYALRVPDSFRASKTRSRIRSGSRSPVPATSMTFRVTISVTGALRITN